MTPAKIARERLVTLGSAWLKRADEHDAIVSASLGRVEQLATLAELPDEIVVRVWPWFQPFTVQRI